MADITAGTIAGDDTQGLTKAVVDADANMALALGNLGEDPSATALLAMQNQMQRWSMLTNLASSLVKEVCETLKSIAQKIS